MALDCRGIERNLHHRRGHGHGLQRYLGACRLGNRSIPGVEHLGRHHVHHQPYVGLRRSRKLHTNRV